MAIKEYVVWQSVEEFIDYVVEGLDRSVTGVYGLPRGGLLFAVMLSHRLNVPMLMSPIDGCLIVDDICDSGESLLHYVNDTSGTGKKKYVVATMYYKENSLGVIPDIWMYEKEDKWIVFPWEEV